MTELKKSHASGQMAANECVRQDFADEPKGGVLFARDGTEAKARVAKASREAKSIIWNATERAVCRYLFRTDGEMRGLRSGWYRLRSLGCGGGSLGDLVGRRGCEIINEVRGVIAEAHGEFLFEVAIPPPKGTDWLDKAFETSNIDEMLQTAAVIKLRARSKTRRAERSPPMETVGGDA